MLLPYFILLVVRPSLAFFFGTGGGGCQCQVTCPPRITCPPAPTCAIPLPCPSVQSYVASPSQYQGSWQSPQYVTAAAPFQTPLPPPLPVPIPPAPLRSISVPQYATQYETLPSTYNTSPLQYQSYQMVEPAYPAAIPAPKPSYSVSEPDRYSNPVQPIQPVQTVATDIQYQDSPKESSQHPTLLTNPEQITVQTANGIVYDDTAPAAAPPAPSSSTASLTSVDYSTNNDAVPQDNEAVLMPSPATQARRLKRFRWDLPVTTDGLKFHYIAAMGVLTPKEEAAAMNARQSVAVPRTNSTCNSEKLATVMNKVILDDVSASKRAIMSETEQAFDGEKFDVFCANGEFSYSIHSRKYCEVTKNEITCFAFR
ncbi:unnamed protein product [Nippostrongylus brasiliensis]|uniref:Ground-like domain-containing protein n=1 Tax=Nippostrongylus brasiliensis TaxID=27835 RepID=A0A158R1U4_NIPBR|nr:unnamed protein product [Nippostrongylus brasiliensis]